jgi:acyl-coenzyme A thioesterase PaaI-like protein
VEGQKEAEKEADAEHFVGYLGLEMWHQDGRTCGRAIIRPEMWATGTRRPRLGLLFTLADILGGSPPTGALTPTVDLRFQLLTAAPSAGEILMEARPLKIGRRLWTGEVLFRTPRTADLFARCEFSFLNQGFADMPGGLRPPGRRDGPVSPLPAASFDELFRMRMLDDGTTEMDPHIAVRNGVVGTIQGGAQATMVEVAAERALADRGRFLVADLQVRYLSTLKTGPAVARPEVLPGDELRPVVRVSITDGGADDRLVSTAIAVCRPDPST